jgi:hypothetical protein
MAQFGSIPLGDRQPEQLQSGITMANSAFLMDKLRLFLLCLALHAFPVCAEEMQIFDLKGATPQELIPLIKPFVGPDGTVTGMHNQVIVQTSAERMVKVRKIISEFDRAPRRLLIHVRDSAPSKAESDRFDLSLNRPHVRIGETAKNDLTIKRYSTEGVESNLRTLQTIEGQPTLIRTGVSRPEVTREGYIIGPRGGGYQTDIKYRNIDSGFYATVQLVGDRVRIEITTHKRSPVDGSPVINQQATGNVISGRVGEWLLLATTQDQRRINSTDIGSHTSTESTQQSAIWVKVEPLPG